MSPYADPPETAASVGVEEAAECAEIAGEGVVQMARPESGEEVVEKASSVTVILE